MRTRTKRGGGCPQLAFAVEMGDVEAPNVRMVEARHEARWPLRRLATEHERGPNQPPREAPYERGPDWPPETSYEHDPSILKSTGNCKPEDEPATLRTAAPGHPDMRNQYRASTERGAGLGRPREEAPFRTKFTGFVTP